MKVTLTVYKQNSAGHYRLSPFVVYALIHKSETGEMQMSATLEYCALAITERQWELESVNGVTIEQSAGAFTSPNGWTNQPK